jgi:hypothetical protein
VSSPVCLAAGGRLTRDRAGPRQPGRGDEEVLHALTGNLSGLVVGEGAAWSFLADFGLN